MTSADSAPATPAARVPRRPALERLPLLALGFVALFAGTGAGLARFAWPMPDVLAGAAAWHGPLMICGFFGVVISLERAVALGRGWAYAAPLCAGAGSAALLHGEPAWAALGYLAGSLVLLVATLAVLRRQREGFVFVLAAAAACWAVGTALWAAGAAVYEVVPWWLTFLILTIAGERLELSRFMPPSAAALRAFAAIVAVLGLALLSSLVPGEAAAAWGRHVYGAALLVLAGWLLRYDIARRTVRQRGLTRYIAVCLLAGYGWLAVGATVIAAVGLQPGGPAYDAALHALLLGFVFSMVFGHAPIIFPAVLRVSVPYHPVFYGPLALLHGSLALRLAGDAAGSPLLARWGALGSALALVAFVAVIATTVLTAAGAARRRRMR